VTQLVHKYIVRIDCIYKIDLAARFDQVDLDDQLGLDNQVGQFDLVYLVLLDDLYYLVSQIHQIGKYILQIDYIDKTNQVGLVDQIVLHDLDAQVGLTDQVLQSSLVGRVYYLCRACVLMFQAALFDKCIDQIDYIDMFVLVFRLTLLLQTARYDLVFPAALVGLDFLLDRAVLVDQHDQVDQVVQIDLVSQDIHLGHTVLVDWVEQVFLAVLLTQVVLLV
jgi:hypothetical protein